MIHRQMYHLIESSYSSFASVDNMDSRFKIERLVAFQLTSELIFLLDTLGNTSLTVRLTPPDGVPNLRLSVVNKVLSPIDYALFWALRFRSESIVHRLSILGGNIYKCKRLATEFGIIQGDYEIY